jgi:glutathione synthase/RimK-type ligase-like ATP-grasp enzyme
MPDHQTDIALLTDHRFAVKEAPEGNWYTANILYEDQLLSEALKKHGLTSKRVNWADPDINWSDYRSAVFRTTWDYFERFDEFRPWLEMAEKTLKVINRPELIRWNLDKHYLADLQSRGIPVVESRFIEIGSDANLSALLSETGWEEAVIKPCISGAAWHTYRVNSSNADDIETIVQPLLKKHSFILQPFLKEIVETGEDTLIVIGGKVTHSVRKVAKPGDFRVQDDHGGKVHKHTALPGQIRLAESAMAACNPQPLYGRVDMVRDNNGQWVVMELEIIEPELWMRFNPTSADAFAEVLAKELGSKILSNTGN